MAVITRIEVVNYLCEGWEPGLGVDNWRPLWPANIIRLCGKSTAVQIPNGSGKTSLTNAVLYLLSRDKHLKQEFLSRCAPYVKGYTHIRVEFGFPNDEDIAQRDLITEDPRDFPGTTYVLGLCANCDDEESMHFYRYCGTLEDAPAATHVDKKILFTPNDVFRASVKKLPKAEWDSWKTIKDWSRAVSEFMSREVVRQNVMFHRNGAGDASATWNKVEQSADERFDEAYFKAIVAPQLFVNAMGESAMEDEKTIEDTITISMTRFIDAKLKVEKKEEYLKLREKAEEEFKPVLQAAEEIRTTDQAYRSQLNALAQDAAYLSGFGPAGEKSFPGIPADVIANIQSSLVRRCLHGMSIDADGAVRIADDALADLLEQTTAHTNRDAALQSATRLPVANFIKGTQVIDFKMDIKFSDGYGGRRKDTRCYDRAGALELASRRPIENKRQISEAINQAFEIAEMQVDTNPFRREWRRLQRQYCSLTDLIKESEEAAKRANDRRASLELQVKGHGENQAAYQEYCQHLSLLPAELHASPGQAEAWWEHEIRLRETNLEKHLIRVSGLKRDWDAVVALERSLLPQTFSDRLALLHTEYEEIEAAYETASLAVDEKQHACEAQRQSNARTLALLNARQSEFSELDSLALLEEQFHCFFGDATPSSDLIPTARLKHYHQRNVMLTRLSSVAEAKKDQLVKLAEQFDQFKKLFGDIDPTSIDPVTERERLSQELQLILATFTQHQPFVEASELFNELYPDQTPQNWLDRSDTLRSKSERTAAKLQESLTQLQQDIRSLTELSVADDASYGEALELLDNAGIAYDRLRDVILQHHEGDQSRCLSWLSAHAPLLSTPVIHDEKSVQQALNVWADNDVNIPIILKEPLLASLKADAAYSIENGAIAGLFAGVCSRRIRAILDPAALEEEKLALSAMIRRRQKALATVTTIGKRNSPQTEHYLLATKAQEAARLDSIRKYHQANTSRVLIEPQLERAVAMSSESALRALHGAREFNAMGGAQALGRSASHGARIDMLLTVTQKEIERLTILTGHDATSAVKGAVLFRQKGGRPVIDRLSEEIALHQVEIQKGDAALDQLERSLNEARSNFAVTTTRRHTFSQNYTIDTKRLTDALAFMDNGSYAFMETAANEELRLRQEREAIRALGKVNFKRAQSFIDYTGKDTAALQQEIGMANEEMEQCAKKSKAATSDRDKVLGLIHVADQSARKLHDLAVKFVEKQKAIAPYLTDLEKREGGTSPMEAHPLYLHTNELRHRLQDWKHTNGPFDQNSILSVQAQLDELDIAATGNTVRMAKHKNERSKVDFSHKRDAFVQRAVSKEISSLSQAEIDAIAAATTLEELLALNRLGAQLRSDVEQEKVHLQELQDTAKTVESESIEILTRLVDCCRANLQTMNAVMTKNENAQFSIDAKVIDHEDIRRLLTELRDGIEQRKREATSRSIFKKRNQDDITIRKEVRKSLIERIFLKPSVRFKHVGIWHADLRPITPKMSEGQKAALQMMWLIKESEYHLECEVRRHLGAGTKRKLRNRAQRVLFFDGLFSNLTDRKLINEAFKGLGEADSNLQLIGLIHNQEYRNNFDIFPSFVVGRRAGWRDVEGERSFVRFEDGRDAGSLGMSTFMRKKPKKDPYKDE